MKMTLPYAEQPRLSVRDVGVPAALFLKLVYEISSLSVPSPFC